MDMNKTIRMIENDRKNGYIVLACVNCKKHMKLYYSECSNELQCPYCDYEFELAKSKDALQEYFSKASLEKKYANPYIGAHKQDRIKEIYFIKDDTRSGCFHSWICGWLHRR